MHFLSINNLNMYRAGAHVLINVSLHVDKGEAVGLLGRNGAGKSTTLSGIIGIVPPFNGSIRYRGRELVIEELKHDRCTDVVSRNAQSGIGFVPEDRRIFPNLTVEENLKVGYKKGRGAGAWNRDIIYDFFPKLRTLQKRLGHFLSGGEKQLLTIARALMGNPDLLLLDEPSEGLSPLFAQELKEHIKKLIGTGLTIVIAEQNHRFINGLCNRIYLMELGSIRYSGSFAEFQAMQADGKFSFIESHN